MYPGTKGEKALTARPGLFFFGLTVPGYTKGGRADGRSSKEISMVGRREIAKLAGVSTTTVTRVLSKRGSVSAETEERVYNVIRQTGYTPNTIASNLSRNNRSNIIVLLVPDMTNYYYMEMFDAMMKAARKYRAIISIYSLSASNANEVVEEVVANRVSGIVNMGLVPLTHDCLRRVDSAGIKFIHSGIRGREDCDFRIDYKRAMLAAVRHLKATGCQRIGFLFGMKQKLLHDEKIVCFRKAMAECGYDEPDTILGNYPGQSAASLGYDKVKKLYENGATPYDALFCLNDMMAVGAIRALQDCGKRVPEDVSVIGFDNIKLGRYFKPSIATLCGDIQEEAKAYVQYCVGEDCEKKSEVKASFLLRESVRALPERES